MQERANDDVESAEMELSSLTRTLNRHVQDKLQESQVMEGLREEFSSTNNSQRTVQMMRQLLKTLSFPNERSRGEESKKCAVVLEEREAGVQRGKQRSGGAGQFVWSGPLVSSLHALIKRERQKEATGRQGYQRVAEIFGLFLSQYVSLAKQRKRLQLMSGDTTARTLLTGPRESNEQGQQKEGDEEKKGESDEEEGGIAILEREYLRKAKQYPPLVFLFHCMSSLQLEVPRNEWRDEDVKGGEEEEGEEEEGKKKNVKKGSKSRKQKVESKSKIDHRRSSVGGGGEAGRENEKEKGGGGQSTDDKDDRLRSAAEKLQAVGTMLSHLIQNNVFKLQNKSEHHQCK
tara:strand:- start:922 stop:1956 length:1035 start_codon:yes stop_codon:yes gene_type:complete